MRPRGALSAKGAAGSDRAQAASKRSNPAHTGEGLDQDRDYGRIRFFEQAR